VLDVGSAHGFFLATARDLGYEVTGIEPNVAMSAFARRFLDLEIIEGTLANVVLPDRLWDIVTFTDSLEYLPDPTDDLRKVIDHLSPNGVVFTKVPNAEYFRLRHRLEGRRPSASSGDAVAFSPSRRIAHYSLRTLAALLRQAGLDIVSTGAATPVDSPPWRRLTGIWLEMESPWYIDIGPRLARRALYSLGRLEERLTGRDHLSPSIFAIGRKQASRV
jgi:SAM-dependent methyltransferase